MAANSLEYLAAFSHRSFKSMLPFLSQFTGITFMPAICADAGFVPCADSGIKHIHWGVEDPAVFKGNKDETYMKYQEVRDIIFKKISDFKEELE